MKYLFMLLIAFLCFSCTTQNKPSPNDLIGKTFSPDEVAYPGGYYSPPFLKIESETRADYKMDDMVFVGDYTVEDNIIKLTLEQIGNKLEFEIVDQNTLKHSGELWKAK